MSEKIKEIDPNDLRIYDKIREGLSENFSSRNIFYRKNVGDSSHLAFIDEEKSIHHWPLMTMGTSSPAKMDFGEHSQVNDGLHINNYFSSYEDFQKITDKQISKLTSMLNRLFENSNNSGLVGQVIQGIALFPREENSVIIGPICTTLHKNFEKVYDSLPPFSDTLNNSASEAFKYLKKGIEMSCEFEDGIADEVRGDIVRRRMCYMNSDGKIGKFPENFGTERSLELLEEFFKRDLALKKLLAKISV